MQSAVKDIFLNMCTLSERPFLSAVWESRAREDRRSIEQIFFYRFIGLEWLNTHTCMCQNASLQVSS